MTEILTPVGHFKLSKAEVFTTNLHFDNGPLVLLALRAFDEKLHDFESRMIRLEFRTRINIKRNEIAQKLEFGAPALRVLPRAKPKQRVF